MYSMSRRVTYSEVGPDYKTDMAQIINYFQDCSCFQSDSLGVGPEALDGNGRVWVLNSWQIVAERYPVYGEPVTVGTWPYGFKGLLGLRNFVIDDGEGRRIVRANSVWAMIDMKTGRPVRPDERDTGVYTIEDKEPMTYAGRKIPVSGDFETLETVKVTRHCLDTNHHMNNGRYVEIAMEYLPEKFKVHQIRVEYKHPAFYKDILVPKRQIADGRVTILLENSEGQVCVAAEFAE